MGAAAKERNENVRRIVSNTGPLLHLSEAQALDLLGQAGEIHVPQAVDVEMRFQGEKWQEQRPAWLIVDTSFHRIVLKQNYGWRRDYFMPEKPRRLRLPARFVLTGW